LVVRYRHLGLAYPRSQHRDGLRSAASGMHRRGGTWNRKRRASTQPRSSPSRSFRCRCTGFCAPLGGKLNRWRWVHLQTPRLFQIGWLKTVFLDVGYLDQIPVGVLQRIPKRFRLAVADAVDWEFGERGKQVRV
jgi:hypothetical protein